MSEETVSRNAPCPCRSGKKYKRCCGKGAEPQYTESKKADPSAFAQGGGAGSIGGGMGGFDPSSIDPAQMQQMAQALRQIPKGQLQQFQSLMQKAMAGKDVSREAAELEKKLPAHLKSMLEGMVPPELKDQMDDSAPQGMDEGVSDDADMSENDARRIVQEALKKGEITEEQAKEVLGDTSSVPPQVGLNEDKKQKKGLWSRITGN